MSLTCNDKPVTDILNISCSDDVTVHFAANSPQLCLEPSEKYVIIFLPFVASLLLIYFFSNSKNKSKKINMNQFYFFIILATRQQLAV